MRFFITTLFFSIAAINTSIAQNLVIDSFSYQIGDPVKKPKHLGVGSWYAYCLSDVSEGGNYELIKIRDGNSSYVKDSHNTGIINSDFHLVNGSNSTVTYTKYDSTNGYGLVFMDEYKVLQNKDTRTFRDINHITPFKPVAYNSFSGDYFSSSSLLFNDSGGYLQLIYITSHDDSLFSAQKKIKVILTLGKYITVNPNVIKTSSGCYFNYINNNNIELLCHLSDYPPTSQFSNPKITIIDTIAKNSSAEKMSAIIKLRDIYYSKDDGIHGYELWKYDPIWGNGSTRITDLAQGVADGVYIRNDDAGMGISRLKILFNGSTDPTNKGYQLYSYDYQTGQVTLVHTMTTKAVSGTINARCNNFTNYADKIFFSADKNGEKVLWQYTGLVTDTPEVVSFPSVNIIKDPIDISVHPTQNDGIYFIAKNDTVIKVYNIYDSTIKYSTISRMQSKQLTLTAYPNPVTGDAHLSFSLDNPQILSVTLTHINGQIVYSKQAQLYSAGKHQLTIPMQDLPTGNYIYTVRDNNGTMTNSGKLLKQ